MDHRDRGNRRSIVPINSCDGHTAWRSAIGQPVPTKRGFDPTKVFRVLDVFDRMGARREEAIARAQELERKVDQERLEEEQRLAEEIMMASDDDCDDDDDDNDDWIAVEGSGCSSTATPITPDAEMQAMKAELKKSRLLSLHNRDYGPRHRPGALAFTGRAAVSERRQGEYFIDIDLLALARRILGKPGVHRSDLEIDLCVVELEKVGIFSRLQQNEVMSLAQKSELVRALTLVTKEAGTMIIKQNQVETTCYLVLQGTCRIEQRESMGKALQALHTRLVPGMLFGELALLEDPPAPRSASVIAHEQVTLLKLEKASPTTLSTAEIRLPA